jgi:hypothetical protein
MADAADRVAGSIKVVPLCIIQKLFEPSHRPLHQWAAVINEKVH